jgi:4-carboxymuconolactone decarboxylase
MNSAGKTPRFPQLTIDELDDAQKPLGEQIMKVSSVGIGGPYNSLLRSPVLGQRLFDLFHYLRWETTVPMRLNEFAILIIGRQWRSQSNGWRTRLSRPRRDSRPTSSPS